MAAVSASVTTTILALDPVDSKSVKTSDMTPSPGTVPSPIPAPTAAPYFNSDTMLDSLSRAISQQNNIFKLRVPGGAIVDMANTMSPYSNVVAVYTKHPECQKVCLALKSIDPTTEIIYVDGEGWKGVPVTGMWRFTGNQPVEFVLGGVIYKGRE